LYSRLGPAGKAVGPRSGRDSAKAA
jgi:hypothetical protein